MAFLFLVLQRIFYALALLLAVIVLNFLLMHAAPGDITDTIAMTMGGADEELTARIRTEYGLDLPAWQQLAHYVGNVAQGNLGYSFFYNRPVTELLLERVPATLLLVITAQILALVVGVLLGVIAARRPNGATSHLVTLLALFGYSAPVFWTGIMLLITFSLLIPLFPVAGMQDVTIGGGWATHALDVAHHMVLPVITLASIFLALYSRLCRASMLEVLGSDYIRTARAKGLREGLVLRRHALRNGLLPVVTVLGLDLAHLLGGAVITETIFAWPGIGRLAVSSIGARDYPVVQAVVFIVAVAYTVMNFLVDVLYAYLNPRVRFS